MPDDTLYNRHDYNRTKGYCNVSVMSFLFFWMISLNRKKYNTRCLTTFPSDFGCGSEAFQGKVHDIQPVYPSPSRYCFTRWHSMTYIISFGFWNKFCMSKANTSSPKINNKNLKCGSVRKTKPEVVELQASPCAPLS